MSDLLKRFRNRLASRGFTVIDYYYVVLFDWPKSSGDCHCFVNDKIFKIRLMPYKYSVGTEAKYAYKN
jgi:hypothetical protein